MIIGCGVGGRGVVVRAASCSMMASTLVDNSSNLSIFVGAMVDGG